MIKSDRSAVAQIAAQQFDEVLIPARPETDRIRRGEAPVLPIRGERIRRRPAIGLEREHVLETPPIGSGAIAAQGEVVVEADPHAGLTRRSDERT